MAEPEGLDRASSRRERLKRWWIESGAGHGLASDDIVALGTDPELAASVFEGANATEIFMAGVGAGEAQYARIRGDVDFREEDAADRADSSEGPGAGA